MSAPSLDCAEGSQEPPVLPHAADAQASGRGVAGPRAGAGAEGLTEQLDSWHVSSLPEEKTFFGMDDKVLDAAVTAIKARLGEQDSNIRKAWLLTEIDHWDLEKERVVLLSDNNLISVKYNFIISAVESLKYIPLQYVSRIIYGDFKYTYSYVFNRTGKGLKIFWGTGLNVSVFDRWNPFSGRIPYTVFASHSMVRRGRTDDPRLKVSNTVRDVERAIQDHQRSQTSSQEAQGGDGFAVEEGDVVFDTYFGMTAMVHNQSNLGFNKRRGLVDW